MRFYTFDFFLWGYLKSKFDANKPAKIQDLKHTIQTEIAAIVASDSCILLINKSMKFNENFHSSTLAVGSPFIGIYHADSLIYCNLVSIMFLFRIARYKSKPVPKFFEEIKFLCNKNVKLALFAKLYQKPKGLIRV